MSEDVKVPGVPDIPERAMPGFELIGAEEHDIPQSMGMPLGAPMNAWWFRGFPFLVHRFHFHVQSPCNRYGAGAGGCVFLGEAGTRPATLGFSDLRRDKVGTGGYLAGAVD